MATKNDSKTEKPAAKATAKTAPKTADNKSSDGATMIVRTRNRRSMIRCGIAFGAEPVTVDVTELSEAQLKRIKQDPNLLVREPAQAE